MLDPQGKVIEQTINNMGIKDIKNIRQGKYFEFEIDEKEEVSAKKKAEDICKKLLANLVIEEYKIILN